MAVIVFGAVGLQTLWITRELDDVKASLGELKVTVGRIDRRVSRLEERG
jgi:hypothetical protein